MRKEPFSISSIVHIYNRGNRKQNIVHDDGDRRHFLQMLFYFNDEYSPINPFRTIRELLKSDFSKLVWPKEWPKRNPLVNILAFCLKDNHFHLIIEEIKDGGTTKFMRKFGTGITNYYNTKYEETGRLFQGAYKAKVVDNENYLKYLSVYVQIKNVLEDIYHRNMVLARNNFSEAFNRILEHQYSSLGTYWGEQNLENSKIIGSNKILKDIFSGSDDYKNFAKDCIERLVFDEKKVELNSL